MEKLVRDLIPEEMRKNQHTGFFRIASDEEFSQKLFEKLQEETTEFINTPTLEELADILEVLEAIKILLKFSEDDVQKAVMHKREMRGGFQNKILLSKPK